MFKVVSTRSGEVRTVYAVVGSLFLFWKGAWVYEEQKYYFPLEE